MIANKDLMSLRTKVREFICNTIDTFKTMHDLTGSMMEHVMVDKKIFSDFIPDDRLVGRRILMTWEYFGKDSIITFIMYELDNGSKEWKAIKKVVRYSYGYMWADTTELRDLLITFVAGGYDGQHFKDRVF